MINKSYIDRIMLLSDIEFNYLNIDAIFADETDEYRTVFSSDSENIINIKIRTGRNNVDFVYFVYDNKEFEMKKDCSKDRFDFYTGSVSVGKDSQINYYFKILKDNREYFYNKQGLVKNINYDFNFSVIPDFKTPDWAKGAVMYQIYVDRFYNGDKTNDVLSNEYAYLGVTSKQVKDWNSPVENMDVCNFYGGDLQG
ncbi:MAG: alpha amylase N-terminal ig-like domain-containing protein, partial [Lachnospirales bacterium]